MYLRKLCRSK